VTTASELQNRARRRLAALHRRTRDPRYQKVMGRFLREGLLTTNREMPTNDDPLAVGDVLWAAEAEPRLLELLPALIVKRPTLFTDPKTLPRDLALVVDALRRDREPADFRGIPGRDVHHWLRRVGRRGTAPSRLKAFRFRAEDQRLLEALAADLGLSETDVVRRALRALYRA
jgi:hypothetical protein